MGLSEKHRKYLTKSTYLVGLSCKKQIWLSFNSPEELPEADRETQHRFDEGHMVGELAKALFQDGIDIAEKDPVENDKKSRELLKRRKPLFEAGFIHKNGKCYARADILVPVPNNRWDLIEVKSSTGVKEEHRYDVSFQKYCYESAGVKISKCFVLHINNEYVKRGKINPEEFFVKREITSEVELLMANVPSYVDAIFDIIALKKCPEFGSGEKCHKDPNGIHNDDRLWREHPGCDVLDLYRGGEKILELLDEGIFQIKDIPEHYKLNEKQKIQQKAHSDRVPYINHDKISSFVRSLELPIHFLDFETYSTAIPLYDGLRPYQQIPFQFSLHIIDSKNGKLKHHSFIAEGSEDPRSMFIEQLDKVIGTKGSVVVYNKSFEQKILTNLGEYSPKYMKRAELTNARMVDLFVPFRNLDYYDYKQKGSMTLKSVLPVVTGVTYENFEIAKGSEASLSYLFITHGSAGKKASAQEIKAVREDLEKYCGQDTEGLFLILNKFEAFGASSKQARF